MFDSRCILGLVLSLLLADVACTSSKTAPDDSDDASQDSASNESDDASRDAGSRNTSDDAATSEAGGRDARPGDDPGESRCPNNIFEPELFEQCDDGNYFDDDGCTRLCEFSCEDDEECDDLNDCNGKETCNENHACERGEWADDGEPCGSNKSCFSGLCLDDVCGDGVINENLGEDCDDGNNIDDDECSNRCTYGCTSDNDCSDGDPCAGTTTCDKESHKCSGSTLDDETLCETTAIEDGWCMKHVCVPTDCGNGVREGSEECDRGRNNGAPGSSCSVSCKTVECGNGTVEGREECDDGEQVNMDSCDENCRAEIYFRWNRMEILRELSPDWCVHAGKNAFAKAFPGAVDIAGLITVDVLGELNDAMFEPIEKCRNNRIIQVLNLADPSFKTSDDTVDVAFHFGELASDQTCNSPLDVDSELYLLGDSIEDGEPAETIPAIQRPGVLQSAKPIYVPADTDSDQRAGALHDFKFLWQMDTDNLSTPEYLQRDDGVDAIELPETMGVNPDSSNPYHPSGRFCAAMSMDGMKQSKIMESSQEALCCSSADSPRGVGKYTTCSTDDPDEDCDNVADLVINGCVICIDMSAPSFVSEDCGNGKFENCFGNPFEIVSATSPDIDTDGDGEEDALSIVFGVEGVRVRSLGVKK